MASSQSWTDPDEEMEKGKAGGKIAAHIRRDGEVIEIHALAEHLASSAVIARGFGDHFGAGDWAHLAALWHDLGKYQHAFQHRIAVLNDLDAHVETAPGKVPHAIAGAVHAKERFRAGRLDTMRGDILATLISSHHTGLRDWHDGTARSLMNRGPYDDALAARGRGWKRAAPPKWSSATPGHSLRGGFDSAQD